MRDFFKTYGVLLAWFVSIIATLGSLFFSEIMHYEPCKLCWLQRICMYPLTVILGYAALKEDRKIALPGVLLALAGFILAGYHYAGQKITTIGRVLPCESGVPCSVDYINWLGFITIPLLSLTAFVIILILLFVSRDHKNQD